MAKMAPAIRPMTETPSFILLTLLPAVSSILNFSADFCFCSFIIVCWLSNIFLLSAFSDWIPLFISFICFEKLPLCKTEAAGLLASFLLFSNDSDNICNDSERLSSAFNICLSILITYYWKYI